MKTLIATAALLAASTGAALADDFSSALPTAYGNTFSLSAASAPASPRTIHDYVLTQQVLPQGKVLISTIVTRDEAIDQAALRL